MKKLFTLIGALFALAVAGQAHAAPTNCQVYAAQPAATFFAAGDSPILPCDRTGAPWVNSVGAGGGGTSSTFGAAFPAAGTAAGFTDGANMQPAKVDANKYVDVDIQTITAPVTLAAGAAVIGHVIADTGSTTAVTGNVTVVQATGSNLHAQIDAGAAVIGHVIADTGSTTAVTGNVTVVQATGSNLHTQIDAGAAVIGHVIADTGSTTAVTGTVANNVTQFGGTNVSTGVGAGGVGIPRVTVSNDSTVGLVAGSALVGKVGIDQTTPGSTNGVSAVAATSGGTTLFTLTLANTTNATNVKAGPGQVYSLSGFNGSSATPVWISLYNNSGTPTCGTSIIEQFLIPGSTTGTGFVYDFATPKQFATGIAFCATTGIAGTGAPAATTYVLNVDYK